MAKAGRAKSTYATVLSSKKTPQTQAIPGREAEMKQNNAGGVTFTVTPFQMLERFLILGSDAPTYYASAKKMTVDNAANVRACLTLDGKKTVDIIVEISQTGRAPKNDPALFALAVAATPEFGSPETAAYALSQLSKVARIGTHLFHFAEYLDSMRGWGRGVKTAVGNWYTERTPDQLAYQLAKYQSRDGWGTKDLASLAHVKASDPMKSALLAWGAFGGLDALNDAAQNWTRSPKKYTVTQADIDARRARYSNAYSLLTGSNAPKVIAAYEKAKKATTTAEIVKCIIDGGLTHEMIPTQFKTQAEVWDALLQKMPMTAMVRNLGNMSKVGLLKPLTAASKLVVDRLHDEAYIKKSKMHPLQILMALGTYGSGHGLRGSGSWEVVQTVVAGLDVAFYLAFSNVVPTGKNILYGLDISGSMGSPCGNTGITCAQGSVALAMASARTERNYAVFGFNQSLTRLDITPKDSLQTAMKKASNWTGGGTDCAQPMIYADKHKMDIDAFVTITDNETWAGSIHASQALKNYRRNHNKPEARQIVMGMTATPFTIADPQDAYSLDIVGFDSNVPSLISDFIRGSGAGSTDTED
jgi:60 kDa SS-A/Ro ribonucleoprotein